MTSTVRALSGVLPALLVAACTGVHPGSSPEGASPSAAAAPSDSRPESPADSPAESPAGEAAESAPEPLLLEDDGPLLLEEDGPLLLHDEPSEEDLPEGSLADNSRCHVCHVNYATEELAVTHARADMGCAACHGESDEHIADESWASGGNGTAPGIMYLPEAINAFCLDCHPEDKIDAKQHAPVLARRAEPAVCTDCHGKHRLPERRCKWK